MWSKIRVFDEAWLEKIKTKNMDEIALMDDDIFDTGVYNLKRVYSERIHTAGGL
jgi:hypothetical protein